MLTSPTFLTNIAKLISTKTGNVIATSVFLDNELTFFASFVQKSVLQKSHTILLALPRVNSHETFRAVFNTTNNANYRFLVHNNVALTTFFRTQLLVRAAADRIKNENFIVSLLLL